MHVATMGRLVNIRLNVRVLVSPTAYKVKVNTPADGVARVGRLVGAHREVAFVHGFLDVPSEIEHGFDFLLVDFLDDGPHLDPRVVGARIANDFEHCHALGALQFQFLLDLFVDLADDDAEVFPKLGRLVHRHTVGPFVRRLSRKRASQQTEEYPTHNKGPSPTKGPRGAVHETLAMFPQGRRLAMPDHPRECRSFITP